MSVFKSWDYFFLPVHPWASYFFLPQSPYLLSGCNNNAFHVVFVSRLNELICTKHLEQCLGHSECWISVGYHFVIILTPHLEA